MALIHYLMLDGVHLYVDLMFVTPNSELLTVINRPQLNRHNFRGIFPTPLCPCLPAGRKEGKFFLFIKPARGGQE